eukprot:scaffold29487_cov131-Isochrysis_galbana.AAC.2
MAAQLVAPMLARKRGLEALGWVPQPLSRPPSQRPPPERAIVACGAARARAMVPPSQPSGGILVIPAPPRMSLPGAEEEDQVISDPSVLAALEHAYSLQRETRVEARVARFARRAFRGCYLTFVFQHRSSSLGPLFVVFGPGAGSVRQPANALRGESEPVRLPPQARQGVHSRFKREVKLCALLSSAQIEIERSREQTLE